MALPTHGIVSVLRVFSIEIVHIFGLRLLNMYTFIYLFHKYLFVMEYMIDIMGFIGIVTVLAFTKLSVSHIDKIYIHETMIQGDHCV